MYFRVNTEVKDTKKFCVMKFPEVFTTVFLDLRVNTSSSKGLCVKLGITCNMDSSSSPKHL